jgi:hypothetical protein
MSQENVEVVRKLFEIYNERSFAEHVEAVLQNKSRPAPDRYQM